jgi:hypothetical protein
MHTIEGEHLQEREETNNISWLGFIDFGCSKDAKVNGSNEQGKERRLSLVAQATIARILQREGPDELEANKVWNAIVPELGTSKPVEVKVTDVGDDDR